MDLRLADPLIAKSRDERGTDFEPGTGFEPRGTVRRFLNAGRFSDRWWGYPAGGSAKVWSRDDTDVMIRRRLIRGYNEELFRLVERRESGACGSQCARSSVRQGKAR
jgi:hypothetical protein